MSQFISRAYNTFEIDSTGAVVVKRSKERRLADEVEYYKNIPDKLSVYFPRILYHNVKDQLISVGMEYYAYDNLGNLMINQEFDADTWQKVFDFILKFLDNAQKHTSDVDGNIDCKLMYVDKTENEYKRLVENFPYFKLFEENETITLNGQELKTFKVMWPKLKKYIESNCLVGTLNYVHGDMCFSNILYGKNPINNTIVLKFIDPRGAFGNTKFYGDFYYDLAKIMHSCDGRYEYFITDNFEVIAEDTNFELKFFGHDTTPIKEVLDKIIKEYRFNNIKIELIQGLIFIGMCARHYDSFERQRGMFLTGLRILNSIYAEIIDDEL